MSAASCADSACFAHRTRWTAEDAFGASSSVTTTTDGRIEVTHTGTLYAVTADGTVAVEWPFGTTVDSFTNDLNLFLEDA